MKDHLGNVRMAFMTKVEIDSAIATLETTNAATEQSQFLNYDEAVKVNASLFDHTHIGQAPAMDRTYYSVLLRGEGAATGAEKYGLAKSLSVMPGDTIKIEVFVKYIDPSATPVSTELIDVISSIANGSTTTGPFIDGGAAGSLGGAAFPFVGLLTHPDEPAVEAPRAYLNWLIFDRDFKLKDGGGQRVSTAAAVNGSGEGEHEPLVKNLVIEEAGYVYIYLSNENETSVDVFFDDFRVEQVKGPVVQVEEYYPFGMEFNSYSKENSVENKYKYNGKEKQTDLELNTYDYGSRMYDPAMGRWWLIDPLSDKMPAWSTYTYAFNNPVLFVDPDGEFPIIIHVRSFAPFATFGARNWIGDKRGFTTSDRATSRLRQETQYETSTGAYSTKAFGSTSIGLYGGRLVTGQSEARCDCPSGNGKLVKTHLSGNDDAIVPYVDDTFAENLQSPDIDVHSRLYVETAAGEDGNQILTITGRLDGDQFPSAEAFVDIGGTKVFLGVAPAQFGPNEGPFVRLWGDRKASMAKLSGQFVVNKNGKLVGVMHNGKMITAEEWNKRFEKQSAINEDEDENK